MLVNLWFVWWKVVNCWLNKFWILVCKFYWFWWLILLNRYVRWCLLCVIFFMVSVVLGLVWYGLCVGDVLRIIWCKLMICFVCWCRWKVKWYWIIWMKFLMLKGLMVCLLDLWIFLCCWVIWIMLGIWKCSELLKLVFGGFVLWVKRLVFWLWFLIWCSNVWCGEWILLLLVLIWCFIVMFWINDWWCLN